MECYSDGKAVDNDCSARGVEGDGRGTDWVIDSGRDRDGMYDNKG